MFKRLNAGTTRSF